MTIQKVLHSRDDIDRLYVLRKGARKLISIVDSVHESIRGLREFIKKRKEELITVASNSTENINRKRTSSKLGNKNVKKTPVWIFQATNR